MEFGGKSIRVKKEIPTKDFYVVFNYKKRIVFCTESVKRFDLMDCLPANFRETEIFIKHFYKKGVKSCSFREYKEYDNLFHGTAKYRKVYETLELDEYQYLTCLRIISNPETECSTISDVFNYLIRNSNADHYEGLITDDLKKYMFVAFQKFVEELNRGLKSIERDRRL
jgi:hypothetical protein